ncbi:hypothetical protein ACFFP0_08670 [Rhizobium puerariae]|uniref:Uncharacterized protein n=1 Tax=Rhizobium puerariae TaxID=1585791 RepID=A0ABV6AE80_9HYPH
MEKYLIQEDGLLTVLRWLQHLSLNGRNEQDERAPRLVEKGLSDNCEAHCSCENPGKNRWDCSYRADNELHVRCEIHQSCSNDRLTISRQYLSQLISKDSLARAIDSNDYSFVSSL